MALFFSDGFESGSFSGWTTTSAPAGATLAVQSTTKYDGTYAARLTKTSGVASYARHTFASAKSVVYGRVYARYAAFPTGGTSALVALNMASTSFYVRVDTAGNLVADIGGTRTTLSALALNTWYLIEWQADASSTTLSLQIKLDGTNQTLLTKTGTADAMTQARIGGDSTTDTTVDLYFDAVALDDAAWIGAVGGVRALSTVVYGTGVLTASLSKAGQTAGTIRVLEHHFNKPGNPTPAQVAARAHLVNRSKGDETNVSAIKAAGYTGRIIMYVLAAEVEGPSTTTGSSTCDPTYTPWRNSLAWSKGDFCTHLHPNESWFLHNRAGARLYGTQDGGTRRYYYMNIGSAGFQQWAATRLKNHLDTAAGLWSGLFLDNVMLGLSKLSSSASNWDGAIQEYSTTTAFRSAWVAYLAALSNVLRPTYYIMGNMLERTDGTGTSSDWNDYLPYLDGGMEELFPEFKGTSSANRQAEFNLKLTQAETAINTYGRQVSVVCNYDTVSSSLQTYSLASYLLITNGRDAFYRYTVGYDYDTNWHDFAALDTVLGAPTNARYLSTGTTYRRDFENGYVTADPVARVGVISITSSLRSIAATVTASGSVTATLTRTSVVPPVLVGGETTRRGRLQLTVHATPTGAALADWSTQASDIEVSTGLHGDAECTFRVRMRQLEVYRWYDMAGLLWVKVRSDTIVVWEGRVEGIAIDSDGLRVTALGPWRALSDVPYTSFWTIDQPSRWRPMTTLEALPLLERSPDRFEFATQDRLAIIPRAGERFGAGSGGTGGLTFLVPELSSKLITDVSWTYTLTAPYGWVAELSAWDRDMTSGTLIWQLSSGNAASPDSVVTLTGNTGAISSGGAERLEFSLSNIEPPEALALTTGTIKLELTNVLVQHGGKGVTTDAIVRDILTQVTTINPAMLSNKTTLLQSPGLALRDEVFEDANMAEVLEYLANLGDTATPPRPWEVGIGVGRMLYYRPRGSAARTWTVSRGVPDLERTLDTLINSAYAIYESGGERHRTSIATDALSVTRFGVTRRAAISVRGASGTDAGLHRDLMVSMNADPAPRTQLTLRQIDDPSGTPAPLWLVRAGDTLIVRSLLPGRFGAIDKLRTLRLVSTTYHGDSDTLTVEAEIPPPTLEWLLSRSAR